MLSDDRHDRSIVDEFTEVDFHGVSFFFFSIAILIFETSDTPCNECNPPKITRYIETSFERDVLYFSFPSFLHRETIGIGNANFSVLVFVLFFSLVRYTKWKNLVTFLFLRKKEKKEKIIDDKKKAMHLILCYFNSSLTHGIY